jgi:hypothetical protein
MSTRIRFQQVWITQVFSANAIFKLSEVFLENPDMIPLDSIRSFFLGDDPQVLNGKSNSDIIGTLGTVGDWFGGTTMPLFTFLSYLGETFSKTPSWYWEPNI